MSDPRYPIGHYEPRPAPDADTLGRWVDELAAAPDQMRRAVEGLTA